MLKAKKIGVWIGALLACVLLFFSLAAVILRTDFAHRYILRLVTQKIQAAIGGPVQIGGISFHGPHLGADLYRITIHGSETDSAPPLFSADRASIDFGLHLFRRQKLAVDDFTVDHPVLHLSVDSKGNSDLPSTSSPSSGSSGNVFDLAIGHFVLNDGEIFYSDRRVPVAADVRDLDARAVYKGLTHSYDATLSYRDSTVRYSTFQSFTHDLQVSITAAPSGVKLESLLLRSGSSWLKAQGQLNNYANPAIDGSYEASLSTGELFKIVNASPSSANQSIAGQIETSGTIAYRGSDSGPAINNMSLDGKLTARALQLRLPEARVTVQNFVGRYGLQRGSLEASNLEADALGGHIKAHLIVRELATAAAAQLDAETQGVSLAAVRAAVPTQNLTQIRIDGRMAGNLHANWTGSLSGLQLLSNATVAGSVANSDGRSASFPVNGAVHVAYDGPKQAMTFQNSFVDTPHSHVALSGILGASGKKSSRKRGTSADLQIEARSDDLSEIDLIALAFRPDTPASGKSVSSAPQLLGLGGTANFNGAVSGQLANPQLKGQFEAMNLRVRGATVQSLQGNIEASPANISVREGTIRNGTQGQANFDVSLGLRDWSMAPDQPVMVRLTASRVSIANMERIAGSQYPASGSLAADLTVDGTEESPNAQGNIHVTQGMVWQQPVQDLSVALKHSGDSVQANIDLRTPAGSATGTIAYSLKSEDYDLQASVQFVRLNQIAYLQEHAQEVTGVLSASAQGHGNVKDPQLELSINGQQLKIGEQAIDGFTAQTTVSQNRAAFDVKCSVSGASLQAQGAVNLTGDYQTNANIDSGQIHLDSILAGFLPEGGSDFHGQTQFHGTLAGPLKDPDQLEVHLEMPSLDVGYRDVQLAASSPIHVDYQKGVLALQRAELKGTGTNVILNATLPLQGAANLQAAANGNVDLRLLQIWNPQWQSSGEVTLNVAARGSTAHPEMSGTIAVSDGAISIGDGPALEKVKGELDVTDQRIQVKSLTGQVGGGDFEVHGFASYRPGVQYNLGMTAKQVRFLYPEGVRTQLTANLNFVGDPTDAALTGQVSVDRLSLTQGFDLATFSNAFGGPSSPSAGLAQNVKLNVAVSSRQELELSSSQLSVQGTADLRIRGTLAEPVVVGRTDLTGGELFFNARRFQIENASIEFANPVRTDPVVNLTATTTVNQFNLTVNLIGPFDRMRTTYTSDPPLAPVDVINLLITGQTMEAAQGSATSPQSVIAGQLTGQVSDRLQKLTGISSLTIDPQIGGNQGNATSQLAIQERVTKNLFFTFATDVTTTQGVVVQVEYQVTPKYSMSAVRDQTGGYEIEIKARKKF